MFDYIWFWMSKEIAGVLIAIVVLAAIGCLIFCLHATDRVKQFFRK